MLKHILTTAILSIAVVVMFFGGIFLWAYLACEGKGLL